MKVGIPREVDPLERRVAAVPRTVRKLREMGFEVMVEKTAGKGAEFTDDQYTEVGATIVDAETIWSDSDMVLKVKPPTPAEADQLREGGRILSFIQPAENDEILEHLAARKATVLAMDCVPRITRAQKMDALSAMAGVAGYRAVIEAAHAYPRYFAGQMTAAGRVDPAKILIIGGGVAGLAAIGTARSMGAIVRAFDTRLAVKEQVESLGGEFLVLNFEESGEGEGGYAKVMSDAFLEAEMALFAQQAIEVDIIITTAIIPGREAPKLITAGMVESMKEGSVIIDVAAEKGGNCSLTVPDKKIVHHGVSIVGYTDLVSRMSILSSRLYASTLVKMLEEMGGGENFSIDRENEVVRGALVMQDGEITWPPPKKEETKPEPLPYAEDFGSRPMPDMPKKPQAKAKRSPGCHCRHVESGRHHRGDSAGPGHWILGTDLIRGTLHRVRAGLLCWLASRLECQPGAAYPIDERDQRHQWNHHSRRHAPPVYQCHDSSARLRRLRRVLCDDQYCRRLHRDPPNACDVQKVARDQALLQPGRRPAY